MASSIVKSVAQQLGNLMVEEAKYLYKVRDKIESLELELAWMECFLRDADNQQHQQKVVCMWVSQVRDLAYDAEDIIEKYLHGVRHHRHDGIGNTLKWFSGILVCTCDAWTLHKLGSEIDNLTLKISELTKRLKRYGIQIIKSNTSVEYNMMMREERRTYSHTEEDVVGLEQDIQQVVDKLVKTQVKVAAISGVGGLGKTTLARKLFKHKDIKDHFNGNCVWVYISKEFDNKTIFQEILRQLEKGNDNANKTTEQLAEEINKVLQGKRCLVVVDDIWTVEAWERLKPAFDSILTTAPSTSYSKILLTTRTADLVQHIDPNSGYLHPLKTLSDDDSWELLKQKAFIGGVRDGITDDGHMEKLGKEVLEHCNGLPIAIITIGGILSTKKTLPEWEDVRTNISSYLVGRMEPEITNNRLFKILELSYNELPFYLKPCFLYLGKFPEDYEIPTHKLYHLWEAEGFLALEGEVQKKGGTSYDMGERYLNELIQRSMILVGKCWASGRIKTCQVHDVIRDMCLRKCEELGFLSHIACTEVGMVYGLPPFSVEVKKLRRCALLGEDWVEKDFEFGENGTSLRSLLVFNKNVTTMRKIWKACPLLRVLDLQQLYLTSLDGMKCLIHLRYFNLRGARLEEIPSCLFDLHYIETLDLRRHLYSMGYYTLSNKFYKMKRLRHLYLPRFFKVRGGSKLRFPSGGQMETIKNLDPSLCEAEEILHMTNLRVLSIAKNYIFEKAEELKWIVEAPLMKKQGQLINTFRIEIQEDVIKGNPLILSPLEHHPSCFKELTIHGRTLGEHVKKKGNSIIFPKSLTRVVLKECDTSVEDGLLLDLEKLPHLQVLHLKRSTMGETVNKMSLSPCSFPQLTEFIVYRNRWFECEVGEAAAPNLQILELWMCENLNKWKNIPNSLTKVVLRDCVITEGKISALEKLPYLKSLLIHQVKDMKLLSFSAASFPQLTKLVLKNLSELEEWEVGERALANLQSLVLDGLERLKKVVMNEIPHSLTQVDLFCCDILGEEGHVSLLDILKKLPRLQKLKICNPVRSAAEEGGDKLSFSFGDFPQLAELVLDWINEWMEWEVGDGALPNLQLLRLSRCQYLIKLNQLPNSLTHVTLERCEIGEAAGGVLLLALENLPCLQQLDISWLWTEGNKMSFSAGSFSQLTQLKIRCANELKEWEIGDGSLPTLQRLELYNCNKLKKLPEGLSDSVHIECEDPCIKGTEKYNTCPHFKQSSWRLKPMWWLRDSCP